MAHPTREVREWVTPRSMDLWGGFHLALVKPESSWPHPPKGLTEIKLGLGQAITVFLSWTLAFSVGTAFPFWQLDWSKRPRGKFRLKQQTQYDYGLFLSETSSKIAKNCSVQSARVKAGLSGVPCARLGQWGGSLYMHSGFCLLPCIPPSGFLGWRLCSFAVCVCESGRNLAEPYLVHRAAPLPILWSWKGGPSKKWVCAIWPFWQLAPPPGIRSLTWALSMGRLCHFLSGLKIPLLIEARDRYKRTPPF